MVVSNIIVSGLFAHTIIDGIAVHRKVLARLLQVSPLYVVLDEHTISQAGSTCSEISSECELLIKVAAFIS